MQPTASRLVWIDTLYGRAAESSAVLAAFERTSRGQGELLLVPGAAGIGKTALITAARQPIQERNGLFCAGKFEQYQQDLPYGALRQALRELWCQVSAEPGLRQMQWRTALHQAVGECGALVLELAPEFVALLGAQPPAPAIVPQEARYRFGTVLRQFFAVFARPEQPLVLFLDDWQWADRASLDLLGHLRLGSELRHLLLIAAYRDHDVDETHPFAITLRELAQQQVPLHTIPLAPLARAEVHALVCEALRPAVNDSARLAHLLWERTQGNPFFLRAFLTFLHDNGWLTWTAHGWSWSPAALDEAALPHDVVALFTLQLRRLPPAQQELLARAACLGNRFDLPVLAQVAGYDIKTCRAALQPALAAGWLIADDAENWRFIHDRVQQAAHGLIEPARLPAVRLEIGRLLMAQGREHLSTERLFAAVEHLNAGQEWLTAWEDRVALIDWNLHAARKASAATAYRAALRFHRAAGALLASPAATDRLWHEQPALARALFQEWAESEFLEGDCAVAERHLHHALAHTDDALMRADVFNTLIVHYTLQARYTAAIDAGRAALAGLGVQLPEDHDDYAAARDAEIARVHAMLAQGPPPTAPMADPVQRTIARLLITLGPPCYRAHQRLWAVLVPKVVNLTLEHGTLPQIGYSHPAFAGLSIWVAGDFATARRFVAFAEQVMSAQFTAPADQSVFYLMMGSSARLWFAPLEHCSRDYAEAYAIGSRAGNLQYAAYAFGHDFYCRFYRGEPLPALRSEAARMLAFSRSRHNQWAIDLLEGGLRICDRLLATTEDERRALAASETDYLTAVAAHGNIQVLCIYKILSCFSHLILGAIAAARALLPEIAPLLYTVGTQGLLPWPEHVCTALLLTLIDAQADETSAAGAGETPALEGEMLAAWRAQLRQWATACPANFAPQNALIEAEMARRAGHDIDAAWAYEQALSAAQAAGFVHWEGVINERAARFWSARGQSSLAQTDWQQAYACFARWGASAKLHRLESDYRAWCAAQLTPDRVLGETQAASAPPQLRAALLARQQALLPSLFVKTAEAERRREAERQAEELAQASERLRVEIAQRRQIEAELRLSEERFRIAFDESPLAKAIVDPAGRLLRVNTAWGQLFGETVARLGQRTLTELLHPDDRTPDIVPCFQGQTDGAATVRSDRRLVRADGQVFWGRLSASRVSDEHGTALYYLVVLEDITVAKETEAALRRATAAAQAASQAKSEFLANISHEIRTPLHGVIGMLQLLADTELTAEQRDCVHTALKSARRLSELLTDVLDLSRIEAGQLVIHPAPLQLADLCQAIIDTFSLAARDKGLALTCVVEPQTPPVVISDELRLRQIVFNLVGNAIKYTQKGEVTVTLRLVPAEEPGTEQRLVCVVRDTGPGIPDEQRARIFQPFVQIHGGIDRPHQGVGLGLAIVQRLLTALGGEIAVESTVGQGTAMRVIVPVGVPDSMPNAAASPALPSAPLTPVADGLNVLLVDDEPVNLVLGRKMLEKLGHRVRCARDGREALAMLQENIYDCVLLDIQMPVMDGLRTAQAIRAGAAGMAQAQIPLLALTAHALAGDRERCLAAGMDDYLSKPLVLDTLREVLARYTKRPVPRDGGLPAS